MNILSVLFLGLILNPFSKAQVLEGSSFRRGTVLTSEGPLTGEVKIDFENCTVVLKQETDYKHFSARQIISTKVEGQEYRGFEFEGTYYLFEVLYSGNQTVVFRDNLKLKYMEGEPGFLPFFIVENGVLKPLYREKDLMETFGQDEKWMAVFIKSNKLDLSIKTDLKIALEYYKDQKI